MFYGDNLTKKDLQQLLNSLNIRYVTRDGKNDLIQKVLSAPYQDRLDAGCQFVGLEPNYTCCECGKRYIIPEGFYNEIMDPEFNIIGRINTCISMMGNVEYSLQYLNRFTCGVIGREDGCVICID